jgi:hypothetical protein
MSTLDKAQEMSFLISFLFRSQIHQLLLNKLFEKLSNTDRQWVFSLTDQGGAGGDGNGSHKSLLGIWQANSIPLGSYRVSGIFPTVTKINHSCRPNAHHVWSSFETFCKSPPPSTHSKV